MSCYFWEVIIKCPNDFELLNIHWIIITLYFLYKIIEIFLLWKATTEQEASAEEEAEEEHRCAEFVLRSDEESFNSSSCSRNSDAECFRLEADIVQLDINSGKLYVYILDIEDKLSYWL